MDKYTKHRFFTALVLEIRTSTHSDAIFLSKFSPFSWNPQFFTSEVYFLYAIQHNTEVLSKTMEFVKQPRARLKCLILSDLNEPKIGYF